MGVVGRRCVVVGSAPLSGPIALSDDEFVVGVNGGISSVPRVDAWVVNSRNNDAASWSPAQRRLSKLMLAQAAGRTIPFVVFLSKHEGGPAWTLAFLQAQRTLVVRWTEFADANARREMELQVGARTPAMSKHALSAGMTAAAWCFAEGADTVRLEGFSWVSGYQYLPGEVIPNRAEGGRGHAAGDKEAIRLLTRRYPGRLVHSLTAKDSTMAKKPTARRRPTADPEAGARAQAAKEALSPAGERERKLALKRQQKEQADAAARPDTRLMVRATEMTYYNHARRRVGQIFQLREASDFRESCMEWADPNAQETPHVPFDANRPIQLEPDAVTPKTQPAGQPAGDPNDPLGVGGN
jgi:hypothetical protein